MPIFDTPFTDPRRLERVQRLISVTASSWGIRPRLTRQPAPRAATRLLLLAV